MIKQIRFNKEWRCFKPGDTVNFKPGLNLLVGENGTGKSTVMRELALHLDPENRYVKFSDLDFDPDTVLHAYDFGDDTPSNRKWVAQSNKLDELYGIPLVNYYAQHLSHGENSAIIVQTVARLIEQATPETVILLDEPEGGLSISTVMSLVDVLTAAKCQLIVCTHHPYIIEATDTVFEMDQLEWVSATDYVTRQRNQRTHRVFLTPPPSKFSGVPFRTFGQASTFIQVEKTNK